MMVSTKGRYALIVCLDLAQQDPEAYISLREVAPVSYTHLTLPTNREV